MLSSTPSECPSTSELIQTPEASGSSTSSSISSSSSSTFVSSVVSSSLSIPRTNHPISTYSSSLCSAPLVTESSTALITSYPLLSAEGLTTTTTTTTTNHSSYPVLSAEGPTTTTTTITNHSSSPHNLSCWGCKKGIHKWDDTYLIYPEDHPLSRILSLSPPLHQRIIRVWYHPECLPLNPLESPSCDTTTTAASLTTIAPSPLPALSSSLSPSPPSPPLLPPPPPPPPPPVPRLSFPIQHDLDPTNPSVIRHITLLNDLNEDLYSSNNNHNGGGSLRFR